MVWKDPEKVTDFSPPQRRSIGECGTGGREIKLTTNYFQVTVKNKNVNLYQYDVAVKDHNKVEFEPPLPKSTNMRIFEKLKENLKDNKKENLNLMAYDSRKIACSTICIKSLKQSKTYKVVLNGEGETPAPDKKSRTKTYFITMVLNSVVNLNKLFESMKFVPGKKISIDASAIQMIEIMLRHNLAIKFTQFGYQNFYCPDGTFAEPYPIGRGKVGVTGFFASMRPCAGWKDASILLNLDMVHTAFYAPISVLKFITNNSTNVKKFDERIDEIRTKELTNILKGLKVRVKYPNDLQRKRRIKEVHKFGPRDTEFDLVNDDGTKESITVENYFKRRYNITLEYPSFNCLDVGNQNKSDFIPPELCYIEKGQKVNKRLTDDEAGRMIKMAAVEPQERLNQIKNVNNHNKFNENNLLQALTFTVDCKPLEIKGRILPPPVLMMDKVKIFPKNGKWDLTDKPFHKPAKLESWAIVNYDMFTKKEPHIRHFIERFKTLGAEKKIEIDDPFDIFNSENKNPIADLKRCKDKKKDVQLVMFVLPATRLDYASIKKAGDTKLMITQCVKGPTTVQKANTSTIVNILLKVNAKLGGISNIISVPDGSLTGLMTYRDPFMIMGADVSHPAPGGDENVPSIVAVVGSYDKSFVSYAIERREQERGKEVIVEMKEIVKNLLNHFRNQLASKKLPTRIIMYRDGVSESHFTKVLSHEMMAMRNACTEIDKNYKPGITFICVQKRHHTRFFCDEKEVRYQTNKNVPPGTIVDKVITHPTETDFYLCSHAGIKGTSRPAHYHLLWDDNDIPLNDLQAMTYRLCHLFARCARSISIPAPVLYAHLAAIRPRMYIGQEREKQSSRKSTSESEKRNELASLIRVSADQPLATNFHFL